MGAKGSPLVGGRHTQHDEDASAEVFEVSGSVGLIRRRDLGSLFRTRIFPTFSCT
jgi:hypothetical protein